MKTFIHKVTLESKGRGLVSIMAYLITRKCCHGPRVAEVNVWLHGLLAPTNTEVVVQAKLRISRLEEKEGKVNCSQSSVPGMNRMGVRLKSGSKIHGSVSGRHK